MKKYLLLLIPVTALIAYVSYNAVVPELRTPASIPSDYDELSACQKQDILWDQVVATAHRTLPVYQKFGLVQLLAMTAQELKEKGNRFSDFAPTGWKKYLHRRGAVAKIRIEPRTRDYGGIFKGSPCGILRLSLTYRPASDKPVAPGLALKVFRDGVPSGNVSALVSLDGQGKDFNFFRDTMSNIVPIGQDFGQKLVHRLFARVSRTPEELLLTDLAEIDTRGIQSKQVRIPRQIFFVPNEALKFSSTEHDVRHDFMKIREGTVLYRIYLLAGDHTHLDYTNYAPADVYPFILKSQHVADVVSTSGFVASEFGDDGIFFRHELKP
ncbi:MAG TPA: hypothetical protein VNJ01_12225 [Bacteriovoracaceae bacterium]|nr:hypothetical protein [Bacteriovoracaceae bacterium]